MSLIAVDTRSRKPIYEQLVDNISELVVKKDIAPGEQLPSVRALAGELAINPNTIQRAYNELEHLGVIVSIPGRGNFIPEDISQLLNSKRKDSLSALGEKMFEAKNSGVTRSEVNDLADKIWEDKK